MAQSLARSPEARSAAAWAASKQEPTGDPSEIGGEKSMAAGGEEKDQ